MLCRLCLYECSEASTIELFQNGEDSDLNKLITKYMYIQIALDDAVSTNLCETCCEHLNNFHKFFLYIEERQNALRKEFLEFKCINNENVEVKISENSSTKNELEFNEESLLDIKVVLNDNHKQLPQDEFGYADNIDDKDCFSDGDNDAVFSDQNDEDNLPLKALIIESKKVAKPKKTFKTFKHKIKTTTKKRGRPRQKQRETIITIDTNNLNEDSCTFDEKEKDAKSNYSKDNKNRDDIIAKHMHLKCEICDINVDTFRDLKHHFRSQHNSAAYVTCCGIRFRKRFALLDHIKVHLDPEYFKCKLCNKILKSKICLDIHTANMHTDKSILKHECSICNRRFAHVSNLSSHMLSHSDERRYICEYCNKGFKTNNMLTVHIRSMHEQRTPYICDTCGKEYRFKPSFERHVAEHMVGPNEPTEQCTICEKWLMPNGLRRHMDRHNLEDVECKICGKVVKSKAALTGHIAYAHKKKQVYECTYCDKTFKRVCVWKEHIAMHTGRKDYNCPHCPREFRSKANMYAHIKKIHVQEWTQAQLDKNKGPTKGIKIDLEQNNPKTN